MSVVLGARDAASGRRMVQYLNRASANGGTVGVVPNSPLPVPQTAPSSEEGYTGGFSLVDMSETVKEKDEDGNEVEKVIPKLGVVGSLIPKPDIMAPETGYLYFYTPNTLYSIPGVVLDIGEYFSENLNTTSAVLFIFAKFDFSTTGNGTPSIIIVDSESVSKLNTVGTTSHFIIGKCTVMDGQITDIVQIFDGNIVQFYCSYPTIADISGTFLNGAIKTSRVYSPSNYNNLDEVDGVDALLFLTEGALGKSSAVDETLHVTPVVLPVLEANYM
jgi:hypothetical protein